MAYQKKVWKDLPSEETPLSADGLNNWEERIGNEFREVSGKITELINGDEIYKKIGRVVGKYTLPPSALNNVFGDGYNLGGIYSPSSEYKLTLLVRQATNILVQTEYMGVTVSNGNFATLGKIQTTNNTNSNIYRLELTNSYKVVSVRNTSQQEVVCMVIIEKI